MHLTNNTQYVEKSLKGFKKFNSLQQKLKIS